MSKELIKSIIKKDYKNARMLIEKGADIDYKDTDATFKDWTPLHHSIFKHGFTSKPPEFFKFLIDSGANLEALNFGGDTPLIFTVKFCTFDLLSCLVQKGANINVKNKDDHDIFDIIINRYYYDQQLDEDHIDDEELELNIIAINKGEGEALKIMFSRIDAILENGFDLNSGNYSGAVRIIMEIEANKMPSTVLSYLFNKGANLLEYIGQNNIPILKGAIYSNVSIDVLVEMINKIGINYLFEKFTNTTPLLLAINDNKLILVKKLIEMGADFTVQNNRAIKIAKINKFKEMETYLKSL